MELVLLGGRPTPASTACSSFDSEDECTSSTTGQRRLILNPAVQQEWCRFAYAEYQPFAAGDVGFVSLLERHIGLDCTLVGCWESSGAVPPCPGDYLRKRRVLVRLSTPRQANKLWWDMCLGKDSTLDVDNIECFTFNRQEPVKFVSECLDKIRRGAERAGFLLHGEVHCDTANVECVKYTKVQKYVSAVLE